MNVVKTVSTEITLTKKDVEEVIRKWAQETHGVSPHAEVKFKIDQGYDYEEYGRRETSPAAFSGVVIKTTDFGR